MFHTLDLRCVIAGEYPMYLAGKLESRPDLITIYMTYCHQKLSPDISVLLQLQHTLAFSLANWIFLYNQEFSAHGKNVYYTIKCGVETTAFRIVYVQSAKLCGPRSNRLNSICKVYFWPLLHKLCNDCVASTYFREQNCIHTSLQSWARRWGISGLWKLRTQYRRHSHAFRVRVQKTRKFKLYFAVSNHFL